ncbi:pyocin knob domain-containing protein [Enterobacter kobei]|uniref:pyocin knob domain-containing protein n=1 Tax=Enterobacter kobei TaxID=208224 RepID=UPI002075A19D|nr:pyocin knob domain-containing protein [Enterobacter kobei]MCM7486323.1 pyocin knob domain-containing protein [Enterobacter kobei]
MKVGAFGLGATATTPPADTYTGFFWQGIGGNANPDSTYGYAHLVVAVSGTYRTRMAQTYFGTPRLWIQNINDSTYSTWAQVYTTANTTKASDGTLKAASPVARIVASQEECQRADIAEDGFVWCGCGAANAEAEGVTLSRLDEGVYALTGSAGLASDGWQLLPPMDPGGMGEMGVVEAEQTDKDELVIRLFKRKYMLSDEGEVIKTKGEPMDVPANSWIDVRLDMPEDSLFNQRMSQVFQP